MANIKYVCLSDMHLGEEDSLLTNLDRKTLKPDHLSASPVMIELVNCLKEVISHNDNNEKPTLVLLGDILELALTSTNKAAMGFERFVELILPKNGDNLFKDIVYIPGNHDHHLWETTRETQYVNYLKEAKTKELSLPWHVSNIFDKKRPFPDSYFLKNLINSRFEHLSNFNVSVAYPNFGALNNAETKLAVFHHGHYIESIYKIMSTFKTLISSEQKMPDNVYDLEAENFAWIDFFWSALGRSGELGEDIESLYEKMGDPDAFKDSLEELAENIVDKLELSFVFDWTATKVMEKILVAVFKAVSKSEKKGGQILSKDAEVGLRTYLNTYLHDQLNKEYAKAQNIETTFIFGHTHKPYEEDVKMKNYPGFVNLYNTGGWIVETEDPNPMHGGSIVLVDEDCNAVSLRMYNESSDVSDYKVEVKEALHGSEDFNPLCVKIKGLIDANKSPWKDFSTKAAKAVRVRAQVLRARVDKQI